jgi:hypothetical protein
MIVVARTVLGAKRAIKPSAVARAYFVVFTVPPYASRFLRRPFKLLITEFN